MSKIEKDATLEDLQALQGRHAKYRDPKEGEKLGTIHGAVDSNNGAPGLWLVFVSSNPISGETKKELLSSGKWKDLELIK